MNLARAYRASSASQVMSRVCESAAGQSVEKGERSALVKSTAARTMVVRRAGTLWCVSHFKEAKSDECVDCLPLFFDALRTALDPSKEIPFVLVADTNLSSVAFHDRFRERCGLVSLDVSRAATTTSQASVPTRGIRLRILRLVFESVS